MKFAKFVFLAPLVLISAAHAGAPELVGSVLLNKVTQSISIKPEGSGDYPGGSADIGSQSYKIDEYDSSTNSFSGSVTENKKTTYSFQIFGDKARVDTVAAYVKSGAIALSNAAELNCKPESTAFVIVIDNSKAKEGEDGIISGNCATLSEKLATPHVRTVGTDILAP